MRRVPDSPEDRESYAGPDGTVWRLANDWLEPDEARARIEAGASWAVEWCGSTTPTWPGDLPADTLDRDIYPEMLTRAKVERQSRKRTLPTIVLAALWRDARGKELVLFWEGAPPRVRHR